MLGDRAARVGGWSLVCTLDRGRLFTFGVLGRYVVAYLRELPHVWVYWPKNTGNNICSHHCARHRYKQPVVALLLRVQGCATVSVKCQVVSRPGASNHHNIRVKRRSTAQFDTIVRVVPLA